MNKKDINGNGVPTRVRLSLAEWFEGEPFAVKVRMLNRFIEPGRRARRVNIDLRTRAAMGRLTRRMPVPCGPRVPPGCPGARKPRGLPTLEKVRYVKLALGFFDHRPAVRSAGLHWNRRKRWVAG